MKKYEQPIITAIEFSSEDAVMTSGLQVQPGTGTVGGSNTGIEWGTTENNVNVME